MAEERIGGAGQPDYRPINQGASTDAAQKAAAAKQAAGPDISRVKEGGVPLGKIEVAPLDPGHPALVLPAITLTSEDAHHIQKNLEKKLKEPVPYKTLKQRVNEGAEQIKRQAEKAYKQIKQVRESNESFDYKMMKVQQILMETMQNSMKIGGEYAKFIATKQAEANKEATTQRMEQIKLDHRSKVIQLIVKVFTVIGDLLNIAAAWFAFVGASIATGATGGVAGIALLGTYVWGAAAVGGLFYHLTELGHDAKYVNSKSPTPPLLDGQTATIITTIQMILSLGGMAMTGGATAYAGAAQAALEGAETVNVIADAVISPTAMAEMAANIANAPLADQAALTTIRNAINNAAQNAEAATTALLNAAKAAGSNATIPQQLVDDVILETQNLKAALNLPRAKDVLPNVFTTQTLEDLSTAAQNVTKLKNITADNMKLLASMTVQVQESHRFFQIATETYTAATEHVIMPIVNQVQQKAVADAEVKKTEQDRILNDLQFVSNNNSEMIKNVLQGFTDLSKSLSDYLKRASNLAQSVLNKMV